MKKTIYRVTVLDENYSGQRDVFLLQGNSAAEVEGKAVKIAKAENKKAKPYASNIELIGTLSE